MILAQLKEEHPPMPLKGLCELFGVSRSWYYERSTSEHKAKSAMSRSEMPSRGSCLSSPVMDIAGSQRRCTETVGL
jgi:hypothetical protein